MGFTVWCGGFTVLCATAAKHLAKGLRNNSTMRVLKLRGNQVTAAGIDHLRTMLVQSRSCRIKSLDLCDGNAQLELVMRIREEFASVRRRCCCV